MHATVTRIPWWRTEVDDRTLAEFGYALGAMAARAAPFAVPMAGPVADDTTIGMEAPSSIRWQRLLDDTRTAVEQVFGTARALPPPPTRPHVSLGYGVADENSRQLLQDLQRVQISIELAVGAVHFVAVHQDPGAGTFTWDLISSHRLITES
ncbi:2'-5' RNA ligase family protein [Nocardia sp. NPDC051990]|uniref:2'-5' RNA ligase family protein n=1 Tax=Nocardia sp. NPDC051990 TaxID=3155285 RepID=UPI0034461C91